MELVHRWRRWSYAPDSRSVRYTRTRHGPAAGGGHPGLAERIAWASVIDQLLPWDRDRTQTPPSVLLRALVMNVVSHRRPLYPVERWVQSPPGDWFWGPGVRPEAFHDEALGRA